MERPLAEHLEEYKRQGFTIFRGFMPPETVRRLREVCDPLFDRIFENERHRDNTLARDVIGGHDGWQLRADGGENERQIALGTELMAATVFEESGVLLRFTEMLMGPFVQHDSLQIAAYPTVPAEYEGVGYGWHHDGFNTSTSTTARGPKVYTPPSACNCLTYLQDMDTHGAFRCVPGSHLDFSQHAPPRPEGAERGGWADHWSVPGEIAVDGKAGDLVVTHCALLHGSTHNTQPGYRYFISEYVQRAGLPHRDSMDDPAFAGFLARARECQDRRILRFFGEDEGADGHQARLEAMWAQQVEAEARL